jgi:aspartate racemase
MSIGILSGMGAAAGAYFYSSLIREYQRRGAHKDSDFPEVFLYNLPFNGTSENGIESEDRFISDLQKGVALLNNYGVSYIVITCNTAHSYLDRLDSQASFVNMVKLAQDECKGYSFGVICSRTAREMNLYSQATFHVTDEQQILVDSIIQHEIEGTYPEKWYDWNILVSIIVSLVQRGSERIILGCTELPLVLEGKRLFESLYPFPVSNIIDPGLCVIRELLK